jgi:hypothetical protein
MRFRHWKLTAAADVQLARAFFSELINQNTRSLHNGLMNRANVQLRVNADKKLFDVPTASTSFAFSFSIADTI